ncbi:hypothetical protein [Streptomyces sp. NPDC057403]|uniref:hypothetical protein n=1 Tax=Streptomyces sp. NPDC057403 TaxID=3346119 RepID=UPI0036AB52E4
MPTLEEEALQHVIALLNEQSRIDYALDVLRAAIPSLCRRLDSSIWCLRLFQSLCERRVADAPAPRQLAQLLSASTASTTLWGCWTPRSATSAG